MARRLPLTKRFLPWALLLLLLALPGAGAAQDDGRSGPDGRFGVIEAYEAPNSARELGVAWTRVRFQWAEVQADGPESWAPPLSEEGLDAEVAAGRVVVGLLIGIPDWARAPDRLPRGLWLPVDDPNNLWANFVREIVGRYDGRIDHWIIWNEPDIDATAVAHTWDGTVDDFYQLQRVAYLVAKETNPDAVIHLAAFTYWADVYAGRRQYMARLLERILADPEAAAHNHYFDVATVHVYFQPGQIYNLLHFFGRLLRERGLDKPIWLVETNAPPHDDPAWPVENWTLSVRQEEQALFMPQAVAAALAGGAARVAVYKMQDTADDRAANPEPFGLVRMDGTRRRAYYAYQTAIRYLSGVTGAERQRWDAVGQFRFLQGDRTTTVVFARLPEEQTVRIPATAATALLVNMWGEAETMTAENGAFTVSLPSPWCTQTVGDYCMIGGETYYLIQDPDGGEPPDGLPPPAIATATPPATAAVTPSATAMPPATATPLPTATAVPATATATATPTAVVTNTATAAAGPTATGEGSAAAANETRAAAQAPRSVWLGAGALLVLALVGLWWSRR